jgi:hypothetical protein
MKLICAILLTLGFGANSFAATEIIKKPNEFVRAPQIISESFDAARIDKVAVRKLASRGDDSQFKKDFLNVKTSDQLWDFLGAIDSKYDSLSIEDKYVAAQLRVLKDLRSFVWRVHPLFEKDTLEYSIILAEVISMANSFKIHLPTAQWQAGYDYITMPAAKGKGANWRISEVNQLQDFLAQYVYEDLKVSLKRTKDLYAEVLRTGQTFEFDAQYLYGSASFQDNLDHYHTIGLPELAYQIGTIHEAMASIAMFNAYDNDDLPHVFNSLARLKEAGGLFGAFPSTGKQIDSMAKFEFGYTSREKTRVVNKYSNYLTIRKKDGDKALGKGWLSTAYTEFQNAVKADEEAWKQLQARASVNDPSSAINTQKVLASSRAIKARLDNAHALFFTQGFVPLHSLVTGEIASVDLYDFFNYKDNSLDDLKNLLPTAWDNGQRKISVPTEDGPQEYTNYFRGRATAWRTDIYGHYIKAGSMKPDYLYDALRITDQVWGGSIVEVPLSYFVK